MASDTQNRILVWAAALILAGVLPLQGEVSITGQPENVAVCEGGSAAFEVTATGEGSLSYHWKKDGSEITGEESPTLTINGVGANDAGSYACVVTDSTGSVESVAATLGLFVRGDLDCDGDVDGVDYLTFANCYNGSNTPPGASCESPNSDTTGDGDVDGFDFLVFSNCFNGSNKAPRCVAACDAGSKGNLRSIGLGCLMYATDYNDELPPDLNALVAGGYITADVLTSPLDPSGEVSYVYIYHSLGLRISDPANTVLAYEKLGNYGGQGTAVLFADGHVECMEIRAFQGALGDTYAQGSCNSTSAANLRTIGTACTAYYVDYDQMPADLNVLVTQGYLSAASLTSPLDPPGEVSYVYIAQSLMGDPENVLAYEDPTNYGGLGTEVLFLDCHVECMEMGAFQAALDATNARLP